MILVAEAKIWQPDVTNGTHRSNPVLKVLGGGGNLNTLQEVREIHHMAISHRLLGLRL
jgi:hypothetical protein